MRLQPVLGAARVFYRGVHQLSSTMSRLRRTRERRMRYADMVRKNPRLAAARNPRFVAEVRRFWERHYGRAIDPRWPVTCANVTGVEDVAYMAHDVWRDEVIPLFNDLAMWDAYSDKNLYSRLLDTCEAPAAIVKRMRGRYYDGGDRPIPRDEVVERICADRSDRIIKPSRTDNGDGVRRLAVRETGLAVDDRETTLEGLERMYGEDFIVQAVIAQHPTMAEVHPSSVNTLRLLTMRWQDALRLQMAFVRFGANGTVNDNASTGGVCCGIDDAGRLHDTAVDAFGRVHATHPTTGYAFATRRVVPGFDAACRAVLAMHEQLPHFDLVSWDIAVGTNAQPIFVEMNFYGASYVYQFAGRRSIFGALTAEVLEALRARREGARARRRSR
jgi:hypothetical protein